MKDLKAHYNQVIISVAEDEVLLEKQNQFAIDTSWSPENHVKCMGTIVSVPPHLKGFEFEGINTNFNPGDECVFHYTITSDQDNSYFLGNEEGLNYYRCELFSIFCTRPDKETPWNMVGGWVLCDTHFEQDRVEVEVNGAIVKVVMSKTVPGLISSADPKRSTRIAELVAIGPNIEGKPKLDLKPGDLVVFRDGMDSEMIIDGKSYLYMRQEELFAKYKPEKNG
jgi:co-chaperonin GroES (HSP10)